MLLARSIVDRMSIRTAEEPFEVNEHSEIVKDLFQASAYGCRVAGRQRCTHPFVAFRSGKFGPLWCLDKGQVVC
jgi:hypothetical protein